MLLKIALLSLALTSSALAETAPSPEPLAEPAPITEPARELAPEAPADPAPADPSPVTPAASAAAPQPTVPSESPTTPEELPDEAPTQTEAEPIAEPVAPVLPTDRLLAFIANRANHGTYVADECVCEGDMNATLCGDGAFAGVFFTLSAAGAGPGEDPSAETVVFRNNGGELAFSPLAVQRASAALADTMPEETALRYPELHEVFTTFELARGVDREMLISDSQGRTIFRGETLTHVQAGFNLTLDADGAVVYSIYQSQRGSYDALPADLREILTRENAPQNTAGRVSCRMTKM